MKISIISFEKYHGRGEGSIGSSMIRGKWLAEKWPEAQLWKNGQYADVMIFQKVYWPNMMMDFKGVKILDLCDPDWFDAETSRCHIKQLCGLVDGITCSTDEMTSFIKSFVKDKPVITIPDRLNLDYFTKPKEHIERARSVVWFGYYHNAKFALPAILPSLKARGLSLNVVSNSPFEPSADYGVEITNTLWASDSAFLDIQAGDMAINPPSFQGGQRFKSNNKTLIAWGLGLPVANTAEEMDRFMDAGERKKEADLRRKELEQKWDVKLSIKQFNELICQVIEKQKRK